MSGLPHVNRFTLVNSKFIKGRKIVVDKLLSKIFLKNKLTRVLT